MYFNKCLYLWNYKHYMSNEHLWIDHHQSPLPLSPCPLTSPEIHWFLFYRQFAFSRILYKRNHAMYSFYLTFLSQFTRLHGWVTLLNPLSVDEHLIFSPSDWLLQIKLQWLLQSPYTKVKVTWSLVLKVTGQKSSELTEPHRNCCSEISWPKLSRSLALLGKIPTL